MSLRHDGKVEWTDPVMVNPGLPVLNLAGDMIATDGNFLELRLRNGSVVGKPDHYYGTLYPISR